MQTQLTEVISYKQLATTLAGRSVISINDLNRPEIELIMRQAAYYEQQLKAGQRLRPLAGSVLATLFFEPSTRTRLSFESAMHRLGGAVISTPDAVQASSAVK